MQNAAEEVLTTVINKFNLLKSFRFFEHVVEKGLGFRGVRDSEDNKYIFEFDFPDDEKTHAFITTIRQFALDNQPHSFPYIDRLVGMYNFSPEFEKAASGLRQNYFRLMKSYPPAVRDLWGPRPSHEEIFKVVVYGDMVKASDGQYRRKYKEWTKEEIRSFVLKQEFTKVVLGIYALVADYVEIAARELGISSEA